MGTIEDTIGKLNEGDTVRIRWKPFIRMYGRHTFTATYISHNPVHENITVERTVLDLFDIQLLADKRIPYKRIECLQKLEPSASYQVPGTEDKNFDTVISIS